MRKNFVLECLNTKVRSLVTAVFGRGGESKSARESNGIKTEIGVQGDDERDFYKTEN